MVNKDKLTGSSDSGKRQGRCPTKTWKLEQLCQGGYMKISGLSQANGE